MDADSLSSTLVLIVSLATYIYLTLTEEALTLGRGNGVVSRPWLEPSRLVRVLRLAAVLASAVGLLALLYSVAYTPVVVLALSTLMLFLLLWVVQDLSSLSVRRWPNGVSSLTSPLERLLSGYYRFQSAQIKEESPQEVSPASQVTDNEVFLTEAQKAVLDPREQKMIRSILSLEEGTAREIMRPRVDVVAVEQEMPASEAANLMLQSGHSRLPVYEGSIDRIVGVIHVRDIVRFMEQEPPYPPVKEVMRPPFFVPESKRLDELLQEFQSTHSQMAIVVDEYGGIEGIVTLEDLLEEIVGEIEDEFSQEEPSITFLEEGGALVDARVALDDLNEVLGTRLEMEGIDTVGGYVYGTLGRVARTGDVVDVDDVHIEVVAAVGRRLRKLRLTPKTRPQGELNED